MAKPESQFEKDLRAIRREARTYTPVYAGRGAGIHTPKKGKGSYTRKTKHKGRME